MDKTVLDLDAIFYRIIMHFGNRPISLGDITIVIGVLLAVLIV